MTQNLKPATMSESNQGKMSDWELLQWDSDFFGIKIARINPEIEENRLNEVLLELFRAGIELIYFNSALTLSQNDYYDARLLDKRVTLIKEIKSDKPWHRNVRFYEAGTPTPEMIQMSRRVARSSRFFYDNNIPNQKVYEMYEIWLQKSVTKEMANHVLVFERDKEILGFATIKINEDKAVVPMLAVDSNHEGKGISFLLLQAVEGFLIKSDLKYLYSETQAKNLKALKVYERFGVKCNESHAVYHLWRKNEATLEIGG